MAFLSLLPRLSTAKSLTAGAAFLALAAAARPADATEGEARRLFDRARELMLAEQFTQACPMLARSHDLVPRSSTLLNLAVCRERLGQSASAHHAYRRVLAQEPPESERARLAQKRLAILAPRVPWLTLELDEPADGTIVALDGVILPRDVWGQPRALDPGTHVVEATAPGYLPRTKHFQLSSGERKTLVLGALERIVSSPTPAPEPEPPERRRWTLELGAYVGFLHISPGIRTISDDIAFDDGSGSPVTCAGISCRTEASADGVAVLGVSAFAGYQINPGLHIGQRVFVGPSLSGGLSGGTGPNIALHVAGPFWVGATAIIGGGSMVVQRRVEAPSLGRAATGDVELSTSLAFGPQLEFAFHLLETDQGDLVLQTSPTFMFGKDGGMGVHAPIGLGFRFR